MKTNSQVAMQEMDVERGMKKTAVSAEMLVERKQREALNRTFLSQFKALRHFGSVRDELPHFPIECLTEDFQVFAHQLSSCKQVPVDVIGTSMLSMISVADGGRFCVDPKVGGLYEKGINLFYMTVMESGTGKSEVMGVLRKPVDSFVSDFNAKHKEQIEADSIKLKALRQRCDKMCKDYAAGKAEISDLEDAQRVLSAFKPLRYKRCVTSNASSEALENLLAENDGVMAVISTEGGIVDIMGGCYRKDGSSNIDVYLKGYSLEELEKDRVGSGHTASPVMRLSLNLTVQPPVLSNFMRPEFIDRGMTSRMLYSIPRDFGKRLLRNSFPVEPLVMANYENKIRDIMAIEKPKEPCDLFFSPKAAELLVAYNDDGIQERIGEDLSKIRKAANRVIGQAIRLAGVLHVMALGSKAVENREISAETFLKAVRLTDYFLEHSKAAHKVIVVDEEIETLKYVWDKICRLGCPEFDHKTLREACRGRLRTNNELEPQIKALIACGYLCVLEPKQASGQIGRPKSKVYAIHPKLKDQWRNDQNTATLYPEIPKITELIQVS